MFVDAGSFSYVEPLLHDAKINPIPIELTSKLTACYQPMRYVRAIDFAARQFARLPSLCKSASRFFHVICHFGVFFGGKKRRREFIDALHFTDTVFTFAMLNVVYLPTAVCSILYSFTCFNSHRLSTASNT